MPRNTKHKQEDLGSLIRAGLNVAAGVLVHKGVITASMIEPVTGSVLALASVLLSLRKNNKNNQ